MENFIRFTQAAGYEMTVDNRSPSDNIERLIAYLAGKEIGGLKFRSVKERVWRIEEAEGDFQDDGQELL